MEDWSKYAHSPAHLAVVKRDYAALRKIVAALPQSAKAGDVNTEAESLVAENDADLVSAVIDRRDVPGRETPLHLAVKLPDPTSAEILMAAGADWSLQNENGWSALQEAVCTREENIAMIIARYYQPLTWAKWCRRLPRIVASSARIRDFYMEITFHFESSVILVTGLWVWVFRGRPLGLFSVAVEEEEESSVVEDFFNHDSAGRFWWFCSNGRKKKNRWWFCSNGKKKNNLERRRRMRKEGRSKWKKMNIGDFRARGVI